MTLDVLSFPKGVLNFGLKIAGQTLDDPHVLPHGVHAPKLGCYQMCKDLPDVGTWVCQKVQGM